MWPNSNSQYGFRSSRSTADFLAIVYDKISRAFNRYGATHVVALYISKAFDRVWHTVFYTDSWSGIWPCFVFS